MYKVLIGGVAELTEEITRVEIDILKPEANDLFLTDTRVGVIITIEGCIWFDSVKEFMLDSTKAITDLSRLNPSHDDVSEDDAYKTVEVFKNKEKYKFLNVFVVSYCVYD